LPQVREWTFLWAGALVDIKKSLYKFATSQVKPVLEGGVPEGQEDQATQKAMLRQCLDILAFAAPADDIVAKALKRDSEAHLVALSESDAFGTLMKLCESFDGLVANIQPLTAAANAASIAASLPQEAINTVVTTRRRLLSDVVRCIADQTLTDNDCDFYIGAVKAFDLLISKGQGTAFKQGSHDLTMHTLDKVSAFLNHHLQLVVDALQTPPLLTAARAAMNDLREVTSVPVPDDAYDHEFRSGVYPAISAWLGVSHNILVGKCNTLLVSMAQDFIRRLCACTLAYVVFCGCS
jgi:hypothetical protein